MEGRQTGIGDWAGDDRTFAVEAGTVAGTGDAAELTDTLGPLAREFVRLAETLMDDTTVLGVLHRVVLAAKAVVPGADLVSVTTRASGGGFETPVRTDLLAVRLDELQYRFAEGPCVAATVTQGLGVTFDADVGASRQYPHWGPAAAEAGVHSVLAVGLFPDVDGRRLGALNAYSRRRAGLDENDRDLLLVLAAHASTALAATLASTAAELEAAQLRDALRSRDVIGQAKGILMERRGCSEDEAFETLRRASQSLNVKLARVAQTLVENRSRL
ncbi:MAG: ANTAR domain-containing protein [Pseudonocardia sp.]